MPDLTYYYTQVLNNPTATSASKLEAQNYFNAQKPAAPAPTSTPTAPAPTVTATPTQTPTPTPAPAATSPTVSQITTQPTTPSYTVQSGDNLTRIASQNNMTLSQLISYNPQYASNPNLIQPGQKVNLGPGTPLGIPNTIANGSSMPSTSTAIDASSLPQGTQDLSKILGSSSPISSGNTELDKLLALQGADTQQQKTVQDFQTQLTSAIGSLGGEGADLQSELDKQGVGAAYEQVKQLNLKAASLKGALEKFDAETLQQKAGIADQQIPTGLITGQQAQYQQQRDLTKIGMTAELAGVLALSQAYRGNADLGMELASKTVDMKYQPILNKIDLLKTQLGFANDNLSSSNATRSNIISALINSRIADINQAKSMENQVKSLAIQAAQNGAPTSVTNAMWNATNALSASTIGARYLKGSLESVAKPTGTIGTGTSTTGKTIFTQTQMNKGASNAGIPVADFSKLSDDSKNYYINGYSQFQTILNSVVSGKENASSVITEINGSNLPADVKTTLINKLKPYAKTTTQSGGGFFGTIENGISSIWNGAKTLFGF